MTYTIKINGTGPKAKSIIELLKNLASDYDFLQIIEDDESDSITAEQLKELNSRFNFVMKNPELGKTWDELEKEL